MNISLAGRTAIITGGSKGIGLGIAQRFLQSGANVAILARSQEGLDAAAAMLGAATDGRLLALAADVARSGDVGDAFHEVIRAFGQVDIVVNNAGTSRAGAFETLSDERLQEDLDQKLFSAVRLTRLAWPQMCLRRWGRVLNVLSIGGKTPAAQSAPTSISRAAGMALTKVLAHEGAPHNVLVNALLVGLIRSDQMTQRALRAGVAVDDFVADIAARQPLGRVGEPRELADLACFLASDSGSYINGTAINVDGGLSPVM